MNLKMWSFPSIVQHLCFWMFIHSYSLLSSPPLPKHYIDEVKRKDLLMQVAVSLAACIYFLNEKTKSLARASIIGYVYIRILTKVEIFNPFSVSYAFSYVFVCFITDLVLLWVAGYVVLSWSPIFQQCYYNQLGR